ncbi:type II secretion system F family protein [Isoptericola sp. NPDC055881]
MSAGVLVGAGAVAAGVLIMVYLVLTPSGRLPLARRRPGVAVGPGLLERTAATLTAALGSVLRRRGGAGVGEALELAGIRMRQQDAVFLLLVALVSIAGLGLVLVGPLAGLLLAVLVPVGARAGLRLRTRRRQAAFADQLEDTLQLLAGALRAGHSLLQALDSVAREAEEPTSQEFARVVNETRVGRDLTRTLAETAVRTASQDFDWVTQAIAVNREVGGNLADVLDGVASTIRERGQVRRQVKALAAEGKLSAIVLMALPVCAAGFLSVANPGYVAGFTSSPLGLAMLGAALVMMLVGGLWLRKTVRIRW